MYVMYKNGSLRIFKIMFSARCKGAYLLFLSLFLCSLALFMANIVVSYFILDSLFSLSVSFASMATLLLKNLLFSTSLCKTYHRENVDSELDLCMVDSNDIVFEFWMSVSFLSPTFTI